MPARILLTKAAFAQKVGRTKPTIGKLCKGRLSPAVIAGKLDVGHPAVVQYLQERGVDPTVPRPPTVRRKKFEGIQDDGSAKTAASLADLTLGEIGKKFGGDGEFTSWLKSLKLVEEVREKRLKNEESEGSLIPRSLVATHILGLLEELHQRLLTELPKTLARTVQAHATAGMPLETSEREVRQTLGKTLDASKSKITRQLRRI